MKSLCLPVYSLAVIFTTFLATVGLAGSFDVTQHHKNQSRDGLYIDPAFTVEAAAATARDLNFDGTIDGDVYAQPLYIENGPGGVSMVIAVTESNNVYALNSVTGAIIWQRNVGTPITSGLPCGNINPLGITGTPVVDLPSRSLFLDAEVTPAAGTFKHLIFSLNVDTGDINPGWPVDATTTVSGFDSSVQGERAALGLVANIVYVPYGGRAGDCGNYRGRLVGVPINDPTTVLNWATSAIGGGVWGVGGVTSDGTDTFVTTGNTFGTNGNWGGGEAVIRLQPGPVFSGSAADYWAPTNWLGLDNSDTDIGGSGPILVDVPGANPSALVVALGKDGNAYLLNRGSLGGITAPVGQSAVGAGSIIQAGATYRTSNGTFVVFRRTSGTLSAFRITATSPPTITTGWTVSQSGRGSPFVTTPDGTNEAIVWVVGAEGDERLHGYDGNTGASIYAGGGANEQMSGTRRFNTAIAARGRIFVAADDQVYSFSVPAAPTPTPSPTSTPSPTATPSATACPECTQTPTPTASPVSSPAKALNISARLRVETGNSVAIGGFIVTGTVPKNVVIRGIGPSLSQAGISDPLADPTLELRSSSGALILADDDWQDDATQAQQITDAGLAPQHAKESAIAATLAPGDSYTAILAGKNQSAGVGLVEIYDVDASSDSQLANLSTRGFVQTGSDVVIGGFILGQFTGDSRIVVRGIGPSLAGVLNPVLTDPTLELRDSNGTLLVANDNWQDDPGMGSQLTALNLALQDSHESGIYQVLAPGLYTAILAGNNGGTGLGIVEVYNIQSQ